MSAILPHMKTRVAYYYDTDIGNYHYGQGHPMKPHRIRMTHDLLIQYGLHRKMEVYRPPPASFEDMTKFHSDDYMTFLKDIRQDNIAEYAKQMQRFNVGEDCPVFDGVFEFCQLSCGGSIAAAMKMNRREADVCVNWMGGLHHAKKSEASGFCYSNDIVLAILELLKKHQRVLYVDIDIHHGDGVEEAFYSTDRVMTVSFHKYGEYFPGTGDMKDVGVDKGKNYSVNFPLRDGINDFTYERIFEPVMHKVMEMFQPDAIVLQCGADSLSGDRLGCFNLTVKGHGHCVAFLKRYGVPLMLVGGGGYTIRNVSRCWTYETAVALDTEISNDLPFNQYYEYFGPEFKLHINPSNMKNLNTQSYLDKHLAQIFENLRDIPHAPSVGIQPMLDDFLLEPDISEFMTDPDPDIRISDPDLAVEDNGEYYDGDEDNDKYTTFNYKRQAGSPPPYRIKKRKLGANDDNDSSDDSDDSDEDNSPDDNEDEEVDEIECITLSDSDDDDEIRDIEDENDEVSVMYTVYEKEDSDQEMDEIEDESDEDSDNDKAKEESDDSNEEKMEEGLSHASREEEEENDDDTEMKVGSDSSGEENNDEEDGDDAQAVSDDDEDKEVEEDNELHAMSDDNEAQEVSDDDEVKEGEEDSDEAKEEDEEEEDSQLKDEEEEDSEDEEEEDREPKEDEEEPEVRDKEADDEDRASSGSSESSEQGEEEGSNVREMEKDRDAKEEDNESIEGDEDSSGEGSSEEEDGNNLNISQEEATSLIPNIPREGSAPSEVKSQEINDGERFDSDLSSLSSNGKRSVLKDLRASVLGNTDDSSRTDSTGTTFSGDDLNKTNLLGDEIRREGDEPNSFAEDLKNTEERMEEEGENEPNDEEINQSLESMEEGIDQLRREEFSQPSRAEEPTPQPEQPPPFPPLEETLLQLEVPQAPIGQPLSPLHPDEPEVIELDDLTDDEVIALN